MFFALQAGRNLHFYVTVTDGQYNAKSEVNVNIQDPRVPINPSKPIKPPYGFGSKPSSINFQGLFPRPPQNSPKIPNYQILPPNDAAIAPNGYPSKYLEPVKNTSPVQRIRNNQTTPLKLVPIIPVTEVRNDISVETLSPVSSARTDKTTVKAKESGTENDLLSLERPIKSPAEFTSTIIPILSVVVVFCTVGAVAMLFRKKIYLAKPKDSKKDMVSTNILFLLSIDIFIEGFLIDTLKP